MLRIVSDLSKSRKSYTRDKTGWNRLEVRVFSGARNKGVKVLASLAVFLAALQAVLLCQSVPPLPVESALSAMGFAELSRVQFSPDGKWLAYTSKDSRRARTVDLEGWARFGIRDVFTGTDVCIVNVTTGEMRRLTGGEGDNFLPVWSPDGKYLAFVSSRDGSGQARLWTWNATDDEMRKLSDLNVRSFGQIEWTPDGRKVLVPVVPQSMSLDAYVARLTSVVVQSGTNGMTEARDSTAIVYRSPKQPSGESVSSNTNAWNLDWNLCDLALIGVSEQSPAIIVHATRITHFLISRDGSQVAYSVPTGFEKSASQQIVFDLAVSALSSGKQHTVASHVRLDFDGAFSWSPNGAWLSYREFGTGEKVFDCFMVGLVGGEPRNISHLVSQTQWPPNTSNNFLWDKDGQNAFFTTNGALWRSSVTEGRAQEIVRVPGREIVSIIPVSNNLLWTFDHGESTIVVTHDESGKQDGFYRIDLRNHTATKLLEGAQCFTCANSEEPFVVSEDGRYVTYYMEDAQHSTNLWISTASFVNPRQLTHINPQLEQHAQGEARLVNWFSDDGDALQGALLLPSGYEAGKRYPLVVWVYGGASLSNHFDHFGLGGEGPFNMQLLATRGYAVLAPDSRIESGTAMLDLVKTVLPGVNKVVELGVADPERLAVMGHSFGGYSTLSLIVQTRRFKAAVVVDGLGDLMGGYGGMDKTGASLGLTVAEQGQEKMGGTPWQFRDKYIENSPIFYLDRVETPLLIIHGSEDAAVPPFLGDEVFVGLRRLGKEVEYLKYQGEGHSPAYWSHANEVDFCGRVIVWLDRHLKPTGITSQGSP